MVFKLFLLFPIYLLAIPGYYEPWGKDADLKYPTSITEKPPLSPLAYSMQHIIRFHQTVISPVDGPRSHFKPSSSEYMLQAIYKYGFFKGYLMGCDRLLRENDDPWVYQTAVCNNQIWKIDPVR